MPDGVADEETDGVTCGVPVFEGVLLGVPVCEGVARGERVGLGVGLTSGSAAPEARARL